MNTRSSSRRRFRIVWVGLAATGLTLASSSALAAGDPTAVVGLELPSGTIATPPPGSAWGMPLSAQVERDHATQLAALDAEPGRAWLSWAPTHDAPRGIMLSGVPAPGSSSSPMAAELFAWLWLSRQLELLAPGATLADFELVSNHRSGGQRSLGFRQLHAGLPVVNGQLSLRFRGDALVYVSAQTLPNIALVPVSVPLVPDVDARALAEAWILADYPTASLRSASHVERMILPVYSSTAGAFAYHDALRVSVEASAPMGSWWVYLDAATGTELAREQRLMAEATVRFDVPRRRPDAEREDAPASELSVTETGNETLTDTFGQVELSANPTGLTTSVSGPRVNVSHALGAEASANFNVINNQEVVWSAPDDEFVDAQLSAFVHVSRAKAHIRQINPNLAWLDEQVEATVNIDNQCNAISNGDAVFFYRASNQCRNTARLADVVYHEIGHSVHRQSLIPGVGSHESALSEGISDYLASTITNDSGMGRGFFYGDAPLREINPDNLEYVWPEDIDEDPHITGLIIAGALWDLREALIEKFGEIEGKAAADRIYYEAHRRAFDIPSMYPEALLADDDDDDLSNGTPNVCEINAAFAAHGLLDLGAIESSLRVDLQQAPDGRLVTLISAAVMFEDCPIGLSGATMRWRDRDFPGEVFSEEMVVQDGLWVATIPTQDTGVVIEYQVEATYNDGTSSLRPLNPADRWYQTFFGAAAPIYCLDPEAALDAWTLSGPGNIWSFGPLLDDGTDPASAYDDDGVLLNMAGTYEPGSNTRARSPLVDISGYTDVRLHYRRWLGVEDGFYDQARVHANGELVWENVATESTILHHKDREWRFHDIDLSDFIVDGEVELDFELISDGGLELGGWTADALCIVEVVEAICGDGWIGGDEQCDDGNTVDDDGCSATCETEEPPPPTEESGEETSDSEESTSGDEFADEGDSDESDSGAETSGEDESTGDGDGDPAAGDESGSDAGGEDESTGETGLDAGADDPIVLDEGCNCAADEDAPGRGLGLGLLILAGLGLRRRRRPNTHSAAM